MDWEWAAWANTISATIVGAAVALAGSWWLDHARTQREYVASLNVALTGVLDAITTHLRDLADFDSDDDEWMRLSGDPNEEPELPAAYELGTRLKTALLVARGDDRNVLRAAQAAFRAVIDRPTKAQRPLLWKLGDAIQDWRAGNFDEPVHMFLAIRDLARDPSAARTHSPWDA